MTKLTDKQVRAKLERIDLDPWDLPFVFSEISEKLACSSCAEDANEEDRFFYDLLRLLAESQAALGEIMEDEIGGGNFHCPYCIRKREIASNARKGGK